MSGKPRLPDVKKAINFFVHQAQSRKNVAIFYDKQKNKKWN